MLGSACDGKLIGTDAGEAHGVAQDVAPQSARGRDDHGIVASLLHAPQGHDAGVGGAKLVHGYELVEHAVVDEQRHGFVSWVVLQSEEALAGIIGLHVVHVGRGEEPQCTEDA